MPRFLLLLLLAGPAAAASSTAKSTVEDFYRVYLGKNFAKAYDGKSKKPSFPFSKSFRALIEKNKKICAKQEDVCGWDADGDVFLNSQETDPKLSFKNSGIRFSEKEPGRISVHLNVYPSQKEEAKSYDRDLVFVMIRENGRWVADDIFEGTKSSRKMIQEENKLYEKKK